MLKYMLQVQINQPDEVEKIKIGKVKVKQLNLFDNLIL